VLTVRGIFVHGLQPGTSIEDECGKPTTFFFKITEEGDVLKVLEWFSLEG
jgi:hypothetical protein